MQRRALVGALLPLFEHLLHAVFAAGVHSGGDRLAHASGVVHFAGRHQRDLRRVAPGGAGRGLDLAAHLRHVFADRHGSFLLSRHSSPPVMLSEAKNLTVKRDPSSLRSSG